MIGPRIWKVTGSRIGFQRSCLCGLVDRYQVIWVSTTKQIHGCRSTPINLMVLSFKVQKHLVFEQGQPLGEHSLRNITRKNKTTRHFKIHPKQTQLKHFCTHTVFFAQPKQHIAEQLGPFVRLSPGAGGAGGREKVHKVLGFGKAQNGAKRHLLGNRSTCKNRVFVWVILKHCRQKSS